MTKGVPKSETIFVVDSFGTKKFYFAKKDGTYPKALVDELTWPGYPMAGTVFVYKLDHIEKWS